ncbi:MAG: hypothetical protein J7496_05190 [Novosphingobium sp.]|nr:hypothetical protein [Novosphingobium sp.]
MICEQMHEEASDAHHCLFCENPVGQSSKPEHILLDALGGRKTTKWAVCSSCNQTFGGTIDKVLPEQIRVQRNMFQMRSGSGDAPPGLLQVTAASGNVNFTSDGTPRPARSKPFTATPREQGGWDLSFNVESAEQLRKYVPHAAAAMGMSEDELWAQLEGQEASLQTGYVGPVHSTLSCGGEEAIRSMVKSSLVLLATVTGTTALRGPAFTAAQSFVVEGSAHFVEHNTAMDGRQLPSPTYEKLVDAHGPMFNLIYVKSDGQGRTLAYFHLINLFSWQMVLASTGGPVNIEIALASNPLDPAQWDDEVASKAPLAFDWLESPDYTDGVETTLQRFSKILELYQELSLKRVARSLITSVLDDYYTKGESIENDERGKAAIEALSSKLTTALMQVPTKKNLVLSRSETIGKPPTDAKPGTTNK